METEAEERTPLRMEETRRGVEKMVVEETGQASGMFRSMAGKAKDSWDRMKRMLDGKKLIWKGSTGRMVVVDQEKADRGREGMTVDIVEEMKGGTVEIVRENEEKGGDETEDRGSSSGTESGMGGWAGLDFLDKIEIEERDTELDARVGEERKRKRGDEDGRVKKVGLKGLPGWDRKSAATRDSNRWKRKTVRMETKGDGTEEKVERMEAIPIPEKFDLGLEEKGMEMNNSGRLKNNFGTNREALFSAGPGRKNEVRNWLASFTKAGCVSCRDENGVMNHKGRDGQANVLIVGDEATPSTVGYTGKDRNDGRGDSCAWVLKVEHLGLEEVSGILQKINKDKKEADKAMGKREHDFFLANGSKILVSSYVHLRKGGIEAYIEDFNQMVKQVQGIVGRADIEVFAGGASGEGRVGQGGKGVGVVVERVGGLDWGGEPA